MPGVGVVAREAWWYVVRPSSRHPGAVVRGALAARLQAQGVGSLRREVRLPGGVAHLWLRVIRVARVGYPFTQELEIVQRRGTIDIGEVSRARVHLTV